MRARDRTLKAAVVKRRARVDFGGLAAKLVRIRQSFYGDFFKLVFAVGVLPRQKEFRVPAAAAFLAATGD